MGWRERPASVAEKHPWQPSSRPILPTSQEPCGNLSRFSSQHTQDTWRLWVGGGGGCPEALEAQVCFLPHHTVQDVRNTQGAAFSTESTSPWTVWCPRWLLAVRQVTGGLAIAVLCSGWSLQRGLHLYVNSPLLSPLLPSPHHFFPSPAAVTPLALWSQNGRFWEGPERRVCGPEG